MNGPGSQGPVLQLVNILLREAHCPKAAAMALKPKSKMVGAPSPHFISVPE